MGYCFGYRDPCLLWGSYGKIQTGTLKEYIELFENDTFIKCYVPQKDRVDIFLRGLKEEVSSIVRFFKPSTIAEATSIAILHENNASLAKLLHSVDEFKEKLRLSNQAQTDAEEIVQRQRVIISNLGAQLCEEKNLRKSEQEKAKEDFNLALQRVHFKAEENIMCQNEDYLGKLNEKNEFISKLEESEKENHMLIETLRSKLEEARENLVISEEKVRQLEERIENTIVPIDLVRITSVESLLSTEIKEDIVEEMEMIYQVGDDFPKKLTDQVYTAVEHGICQEDAVENQSLELRDAYNMPLPIASGIAKHKDGSYDIPRLQEGSLNEYINSFELIPHKSCLAEEEIVDYFINRLKEDIASVLEIFKPTTLQRAIELANLQEKAIKIMKSRYHQALEDLERQEDASDELGEHDKDNKGKENAEYQTKFPLYIEVNLVGNEDGNGHEMEDLVNQSKEGSESIISSILNDGVKETKISVDEILKPFKLNVVTKDAMLPEMNVFLANSQESPWFCDKLSSLSVIEEIILLEYEDSEINEAEAIQFFKIETFLEKDREAMQFDVLIVTPKVNEDGGINTFELRMEDGHKHYPAMHSQMVFDNKSYVVDKYKHWCQQLHKGFGSSTFIIWNWFYKDFMKEVKMIHPGNWQREWIIAWICIECKLLIAWTDGTLCWIITIKIISCSAWWHKISLSLFRHFKEFRYPTEVFIAISQVHTDLSSYRLQFLSTSYNYNKVAWTFQLYTAEFWHGM